MERGNYLGIYLSKENAAVVCLGPQGRERNVLGCFSVSLQGQQEQSQQVLGRLIAEGCAEKGFQFSEVAVALDCAAFMQHNVHSEFEDPKQIAATIRFDTEEALSTDISDVAIAFKINSSDQNGSELTVFTSQRKILSDILNSLQGNNIDPISIEPDINCLSRFILQNVSLPEGSRLLFGVLSRRRGYFITFEKSQKQSSSRTFLVDPLQDKGDLLAREVLVTSALGGTGESINCLKVFDTNNSVDFQRLSERVGIEVNGVDLTGSVAVSPGVLADCEGPVDFAVAYGAALAHLDKVASVNFRNDFMPYQGKKVRVQKALKFLSVFVMVLILAVGVYFQLQLLQKNKYRSQLGKKFEKQYSAVMFDKKPLGKSGAVSKLGTELRRIQDVKSGQLSVTGEESISAKLTLVLEAFNKCASQTDLSIESVSITTRTISIVGETSTRKNTLKLFEAIKGRLDILQQRLDSKAGRDNFRITVVPRK